MKRMEYIIVGGCHATMHQTFAYAIRIKRHTIYLNREKPIFYSFLKKYRVESFEYSNLEYEYEYFEYFAHLCSVLPT